MGSCVRCGEEVREEARFCGSCGSPLSVSAGTGNRVASVLGASESDLAELLCSSGQVVTCARCGELTRAGAKFCRSCGLGLPASEDGSQREEELALAHVMASEPTAGAASADGALAREVRAEYESFRRGRRRNASAFALLALATAGIGFIYRHYSANAPDPHAVSPFVVHRSADRVTALPQQPVRETTLTAAEADAPADEGRPVVDVAVETSASPAAIPRDPSPVQRAAPAAASGGEGEARASAASKRGASASDDGGKSVRARPRTRIAAAKTKQADRAPKRALPAKPSAGKRSPDEMYARRTAAECDTGLGGLFCRIRVRDDVCSGKWVDRRVPGRSVCLGFVARQASAP